MPSETRLEQLTRCGSNGFFPKQGVRRRDGYGQGKTRVLLFEPFGRGPAPNTHHQVCRQGGGRRKGSIPPRPELFKRPETVINY